MRIGYIISHRGETGPNRVVMDLVKLMSAHGHECCVFYLRDVCSGGKDFEYPCEVRKISLWKGFIDYDGFDVIHSNGFRANMFVFLHKPIKKCKTLFVTTLHSDIFEEFGIRFGSFLGPFLSWIFILANMRHDRIVALTEYAMSLYSTFYKNKKLSYIYNTRIMDRNANVSADEKKEIKSFKNKGVLLGMTSELVEIKGIETMLKAMTLLPNDFKLMIVGDGPLKKTFENRCKNLGIIGRVLFAGERHDAYRYIPFYDIFVQTSQSEGFSLSMLEAAAYGKKCVCSDLPIFSELYGDDVIKFKKSSEVNLADAILEISIVPSCGENLKRRYMTNFSPELFYKNYYKLYCGK